MKKKTTGDCIQAENAGWTFGGPASEHFDAHIERSVPLYHEGHNLAARLSDFFLHDGAVCYDLGCATGVLLARLAGRNKHKAVRFTGIDNESAIAAKARERCSAWPAVDVVVGDVCDYDYAPADLIVCYYTLQFVKPKQRQQLLNQLYAVLNWGGALILFEKVRGPDARFQDIMTSLYNDYKLDRGYSGEEIIAKSRSLKGVLEPFSTQGNLDLLKRAGFVDIMTVMKYVCFEGFLAIK